jgi:hypothetical protein
LFQCSGSGLARPLAGGALPHALGISCCVTSSTGGGPRPGADRFDCIAVFHGQRIFESLEVLLNRIWLPEEPELFQESVDRPGLIFACGALMLISITLTALKNEVFKVAAIPMSMLLLFLIYWLLPNCKVNLPGSPSSCGDL